MKTPRIPKNAHKRWAWIIYQLALRDLNLSDIARELGINRQAVYHAARRPYPRVERAIARKLGLCRCQLWPERYPECGPDCAKHSRDREPAQ